MKKSILSMILVLVLALGVCAGAAGAETETEIDLHDTSCTINGVTYTFPVPVSELVEAGLNVPDVSGLEEGSYYPSVEVDDGKFAFYIRVDCYPETEEKYWATGCTLSMGENSGAVVGGMIIGQTTIEDVIAAMGADNHGNTSGEELDYYLDDMNYTWYLKFETDKAVKNLKRVSMSCDLVANYGDVRTINFAEPSADLPDAAAMAYDEFILCGHHYKAGDTVSALVGNGWRVEKADEEIDARSGSRVSGDRFWAYNGEGFAKVGAFNLNETACAKTDCVIDEVEVTADMSAELILSGDIRIGSTLDEAKAVFGEPSSSKAEDGVTVCTFSLLNSVITYTVTCDDQGTITALAIDGLMNR